MTASELGRDLILVALGLPAGLWLLMALTALLGAPLGERSLSPLVRAVFSLSALALLGGAGFLWPGGAAAQAIDLGAWFVTGDHAFHIRLLADPPALIFASLCAILCGIVAAFASRYLHREPGYPRFFALLSLFSVGILLIALAGSIEVVLAGWELVGLASALLIAFYHERPGPAENGLWVFSVYRLTDLGLLGAAVLIHHLLGSGDFERFLGAWPSGVTPLSSGQAGAVALLFLVAALGKGALLPFSGWLPRAMEGPTPSSAIFYGALSIHAGAFLLLRAGPLLDAAPLVAGLVVLVGLATAVHATMVGRVQTDIKSALAYASLTQVGIILIEIGVGLRWLPLLHIVGHASLRSLQILRAPSLLHDFHTLEAAVGGHLPRTGVHLEALPPGMRRRLYAASLARWRLDELLVAGFVEPLRRLCAAFDRAERGLCRLLGGAPPASPSNPEVPVRAGVRDPGGDDDR